MLKKMGQPVFDMEAVEYPAFVVVYGSEKDGITSHNRHTYGSHFACDFCRNAEDARRLFEGYEGRLQECKVYVVPSPSKIQQVGSAGPWNEYSAVYEDFYEDVFPYV